MGTRGNHDVQMGQPSSKGCRNQVGWRGEGLLQAELSLGSSDMLTPCTQRLKSKHPSWPGRVWPGPPARVMM